MAKRKNKQQVETPTVEDKPTTTEDTPVEETEGTKTEAPEGTYSQPTETAPEETTGSGDESTGEGEPTKDDSEEEPKPEVKKPQAKSEAKGESKPAVSKNDRVANIQRSLEEYVEKMGPNAIVSSDDIRSNQIRLKNVINTVMSTDDATFEEAMTTAVKCIRKERGGAFSDMLVYRGFQSLRIRQEERKRFEMLLQLMLASADSKTTKKIGDKIDLSVILRYVKDDAQQNRLQAFFS